MNCYCDQVGAFKAFAIALCGVFGGFLEGIRGVIVEWAWWDGALVPLSRKRCGFCKGVRLWTVLICHRLPESS